MPLSKIGVLPMGSGACWGFRLEPPSPHGWSAGDTEAGCDVGNFNDFMREAADCVLPPSVKAMVCTIHCQCCRRSLEMSGAEQFPDIGAAFRHMCFEVVIFGQSSTIFYQAGTLLCIASLEAAAIQ